MKKHPITSWLAVILVAFSTTAAFAYENANEIGYFALQVPDPSSMVVDGLADDWDWFDPEFIITTDGMAYMLGDPLSPDDLDVAVRVGWTPEPDNRIYIFVHVVDDVLNIDETDMDAGWQDDDLEIIMDADHAGGWHEPPDALRTGHQQWTFHIPTLNGYPQVAYLRFNQPPEMQWAIDDGLVLAAVDVQPGAVHGATNVTVGYEISMPAWDFYSPDGAVASVPHVFVAGQTIGMGVSLNEADDGGRSNHLTTNMEEGGAHDSDFTSEFTMLAIGEYASFPLAVVSPNGGEEWEIDTVHNIWWVAESSISDVKIEYSSDGGTDWNLIAASTENDGVHQWTVPDQPFPEVLVRISDAADGDPVDLSDEPFSIVLIPPKVIRQLPAPEGSGSPDAAITVKFDLPMDPGTLNPSTFLVEGNVSGPISGTVTYDPETQSATFFQDAGFQVGEIVIVTVSGDVMDELGVGLDGNWNDAPEGSPDDDLIWEFTVVEPLEMTAYPTATPPVLDGRILDGEYAEAVPVYVEFGMPGRLPGIVPDWIASPDSPTDLSFTVYALYTDTDLYIAVDAADDFLHDDSEQVWQNDDVELFFDGDLVGNDMGLTPEFASAEGFEIYMDISGKADAVGSEFGIDWFAVPRTSEGRRVIEFKIPLTSIDIEDGTGTTAPGAGDAIGFNIVASDDDNGGGPYEHPYDSYGAWSGSYENWRWNRETDWGRLYLSPTPAGPIAIVSPNGSESWAAGSTQEIVWQADAGFATVVIEYSTDGGSTWTEIAGDAPNTGLYDWTLPPGSADEVLLIISDPSLLIEDYSDRPFSIHEPDPHRVDRVWTHRRAVFPDEPFSIRAKIEPGEAEIVLVEAEIFSEATQQLEDTVVLADDGVDPDIEAGDHVFSGAFTIADPGKYPLDVVIEDAGGVQTRQIDAGRIDVVHTIVQFPRRILVDPADLPSVSVPLLIEDDGTGALTEGFFSAEFDLHLQGNGLEPQAAAPLFLGSGLDGGIFLSQFSANPWWDGEHDNINLETSLAGAEVLFPTLVPNTNQAILAFVDLELDVVFFDHLGLHISHVAFDEDAMPHLFFEGGALELGKGDIDLSATIDAFDASLVLMHTVRALNLDWIHDDINGPVEATYGFELLQEVWRQADVSGKAGITAFDASLIMRRDVGFITHFPAEENAYRLWEPPDWWRPPAAPAVKPVAATPPLQRIVSLGSAAEQSDGTLLVPISIDAMEDVLAGTVVLEFDATHLQPMGVRPTDLTENYLLADHARGNSLRVSFAGVEAQTGSGPFAELLFERIDATFAPDDLRLIEVQLNEGEVETRIAASTLAVAAPLPQTLALHPNYPNPFNPRTTINYDLPADDRVRLTVYNLTGQQVRVLIDGPQPAGRHSAVWHGVDDSGFKVGSGVYLFRLETESSVLVRKMLLIK